MRTKKGKAKVKGFFNLSTGQSVPYFTPFPDCPTEPVKCHRNLPSKRRLKDCPVEVAGQCPEANAQRLQVEQLTKDKETVHAILKSADIQEQCMRLLLTGSDEDIPDESFFYALKIHGYKILSLPFAQQKMDRWEGEKKNTDKNIRDKAKDNFIKIGTSLAHVGHDRQKISEPLVALEYQRVYKTIKGLGISKRMTEKEKRLKLEKVFNGIDSLASVSGTNKELAIFITSKKFGISMATVETYMKKRCIKIGDAYYRKT